MTLHNRGWFRFSLRTLFVVMTLAAIPLGWVGYSLNWIRQRHEILSLVNGPVEFFGTHRTAPAGLWVFGETGRNAIRLPSTTSVYESAAVKRLYPESVVMVMPPRQSINPVFQIKPPSAQFQLNP